MAKADVRGERGRQLLAEPDVDHLSRRLDEIRPERVLAWGQHLLAGIAAEWIWVARVVDDHVALVDAIHAQRLLEGSGIQPVVENPSASADRCLAAFEWRPCEAGPRSRVPAIVEVCLQFFPQAAAQREILAHTPVVLDEQARLPHRVSNERIAGAPREGGRPASVEVRQARERERSQIVGPVVAAIRAPLEERARPDGVLAFRPVNVGRPLELRAPSSAGLLCASGGEGIEDIDGRQFKGGVDAV